MSKTDQAGQTRRQQLRAQQIAEAQKARKKRQIQVGTGIVAAVVVAGLVIWAAASGGASSAGQIVPPNANADRSGIVAKLGEPAADAPTVRVYQDYQCPFCQKYDAIFGARLDELAAKGLITLEYRTMTFLDTNLGNTSSTDSAIAAACSDTVGAYPAYHKVVFENQPTEEGVGYTQEQLRVDFPAEAGITGDTLTTFQSCYDSRATENFVKGTNEAAFRAGITSTPTYVLVNAEFPEGKVLSDELNPNDAYSLDRILGTLGK